MKKSNNLHAVDTKRLTCDCADFKYRRRKFNKSDERRICKHLAAALGVEQVSVDKVVEQPTDRHWSEKKRHPFAEADKMVGIVSRLLNTKPAVDKIERFEVCGSYRRKKETIGDLDIIIVMKDDDWSNNVEVLSHICNISEKVMTRGEQKSSILFGGIQIDFRFVKKEFFVFQLMHATGSKDENKRLRSLAKSQGLKLNEYGLFKAGKPVKGLKTEQSVYKALGIPFVKPENR